ncbi:Protein prenyltransferase, alpha subunit [Corchorus capsularis]|uniref:Protein prenyltransferase, alpha subunit n=1 Tax=Corchorus capsularis TaxID=210143 RepID=A0A1R3IPG1_COCAP|nr:Protein prenyltransferase, alpha subunit [Corchorus capsularis]
MSQSSWDGNKAMDLLNQLEAILESDPLIDEVGFIHPSQFVILSKEGGESSIASEDGVSGPTNTNFWNTDHKLGISTEVLLPLCKAAKSAFMDAMKQYKTLNSLMDNKHEEKNIVHGSSPCQSFESEVMKHSRALLLLSCDFGTAWNTRRLVISKKQHLAMFMDELLLSTLVLSYSPKSEQAWSHRRWVIKMIAGKCSTLHEIISKESELVEKIAERSKMNYRAWNHRCWLVSYMTRQQMLHELKRSRDWAGLHVADNSCFHYRRRLMLEISENSCCKQELQNSYDVQSYQVLKEELDWNEVLIKRYIGREALWLHRRFLSQCLIQHLTANVLGISSHSEQKTIMVNEISTFMNNELCLLNSCSTIQDMEFEDFQAQAMHSAFYILWLIKCPNKAWKWNVSQFFFVFKVFPKVMVAYLVEWEPLQTNPRGQYNEAFYFLECMVGKGYKPDVVLCTRMIKGFFNGRNVEKAIRVMEILEKYGEPDVFAYNALISGFCKINRLDFANRVLDRMRRRGISPDVVTYNIMIGSFCSRGKLDSAYKVMDQLLKDNCKPTVITYTILIEAHMLQGGITEAMKLLDEMVLRGLRPDMFTYNTIIRGMCKDGMLDKAFEFVRSLKARGCQLDVISYNNLLRALLNQGKWVEGEKLMTEMVSRGCEPNVVTYSILISSLCREGKVEEAVNVLKMMKDRGLKPDAYSYDPLISAFCKEGRLDLAIEFLDYMISDGCLPDIVNYNTVLATLCKNGKADQALEIFEKLTEVGCPPNASSYNTMFSALWSSGDKVKALQMISEMLSKRIGPDEITYNSLISCLCRDGMVDEAIELLVDMESSRFPPTVISYNIVLLGLCKVHRIQDAIEVLAAMVDKGCRPNETTYILLIEGIGFAGWRSEAMELTNALVRMEAISEDSFKRLSKNFPLLDVYKELSVSD